jgi:hypothetical protein
MKYAILALGLLITPVKAVEYTKDECATLKAYYKLCSNGSGDEEHAEVDPGPGTMDRRS